MTSPKPRPTPRRNPPKPAAEMRDDVDRQRQDELTTEVVETWVSLRQQEPLMVDLLLPDKLLDALDELAKVTAR